MNYNNDFFTAIQEIRKFLSKWLLILNPAIIALLVFIFNIDLISFLTSFSPETKSKIVANPRLLLTLNTVLLTVLGNIFINIFKSPGVLKIKMINNNRKNNHHFDADAMHRSHSIHLDGSIEFKSIIIKWIFLNFTNLKIQIKYPDWVDISIDNEPSVLRYIDYPQSKIHKISLNHLFEQESKSKKEFYIHYVLIANSSYPEKDNIVLTLVESKLVLILFALFFDTKIEDYEIEMRSN